MSERERGVDWFDESFSALRAAQEGLARQGYLFLPVAKEHCEALVTEPLVHRLRTQIKKRGFGKVAGRVAVTFSGWARDPREVYEVPEIRAYWQKLDAEVPEWPALVASLPVLGFNGPGLQLMLLGQIDAVLEHPGEGRYQVHVVDAPQILENALTRIRQAGRTYHLSDEAVGRLADQFCAAAGFRF